MKTGLGWGGFVLTFALCGCNQPVELVITFDDLPFHGSVTPGVKHAEITREIVQVLHRHHVPEVYGFINDGAKLDESKDEVYQIWTESGFPLGNHGYLHKNVSKVPMDEFKRDVELNEPALEKWTRNQKAPWKIFRFPFLKEGKDEAYWLQIHEYLHTRGYEVAPVTVDFQDWAYNDPFVRCSTGNHEKELVELKKDYLESALLALRNSVTAAQEQYQQSIPHILLLHIAQFDSVMLDSLLTRFEKHGVTFVPLTAALKHPVHQPTRSNTKSGRGSKILLPDVAPLSKLENLCR